MGNPGDVERFRDVIAQLQNLGAPVRRVRVGSIEVEFAPNSPPIGTALDSSPEEPTLSPAEQEEEARRLYDSLMYGASEGLDS